MFFYRNFTIANALRSRIVLTFIYFIKLFQATTRFTLIDIFAINI